MAHPPSPYHTLARRSSESTKAPTLPSFPADPRSAVAVPLPEYQTPVLESTAPGGSRLASRRRCSPIPLGEELSENSIGIWVAGVAASARRRRPSTSAPPAARPIALSHALKSTKRNLAKRHCHMKKSASHHYRRKLNRALDWWETGQSVLMTRITIPLYVNTYAAYSAKDNSCPAKSPNTMCPAKAPEVEDPSWLVDNNRLRSLAELKEIQVALRDSELQKMILKIDGSSEPEKELEKAMEVQAFHQFTDKILDIVSPKD
ncbi:hypothetical protein U9M48_017266 [Paspalum notatum var. saurae]|uniref:Uncharacterized protein n=1 Tax=Paspalum notatum var. saurae TaxID=547442 RepID=A0AAQ3WNN8_PASNO